MLKTEFNEYFESLVLPRMFVFNLEFQVLVDRLLNLNVVLTATPGDLLSLDLFCILHYNLHRWLHYRHCCCTCHLRGVPLLFLFGGWLQFICCVSEYELQVILKQDKQGRHHCTEFFLEHEGRLLNAWGQGVELFAVDHATDGLHNSKEEGLVADVGFLFRTSFCKLEYLIDHCYFFL